MTVELTGGDIATLLESLKFSKRATREARDTPYSVRQENLGRLEAFEAKLLNARSTSNPSEVEP